MRNRKLHNKIGMHDLRSGMYSNLLIFCTRNAHWKGTGFARYLRQQYSFTFRYTRNLKILLFLYACCVCVVSGVHCPVFGQDRWQKMSLAHFLSIRQIKYYTKIGQEFDSVNSSRKIENQNCIKSVSSKYCLLLSTRNLPKYYSH